MKKIASIGLFMFAFQTFQAQINLDWVNTLSSSGEQRGYATQIDADGYIYNCGRFTGTVDFDPSNGTTQLTSIGLGDIYLSKTNESGNLVWVKSIEGDNLYSEVSIDLDFNGNCYISSYFNASFDADFGVGLNTLNSLGGSDVFMIKINSSGNFVWAKQFGGTGNERIGNVHISNANLYLSGRFESSVDFDPSAGTNMLTSAGGRDGFLIKLDTIGDFYWAKAFGGSGNDWARDFATSSSEDIYITGNYSNTVDFDLSSNTLELTSNGNEDIFVCKLNSLGEFVWAKSIGGTASERPNKLVFTDNNSSIYIVGFFGSTVDFDPNIGLNELTSNGDIDAFVLKLDNSGNYVWASNIGGILDDEGLSISEDDQSNIIVGGSFQETATILPLISNPANSSLTSSGNLDAFICKFDLNGIVQWSQNIGGTGNDRCFDLSLSGSTNLYVTGSFEASVDFDPSNASSLHTSLGGEDAYLVKFVQATSNLQNWNETNSIKLFPNPSNGCFFIESSNTEIIRLVNSIGQLIIPKLTVHSGKIDVSELPGGIYILESVSKGGNVSKMKLILTGN